MHDITETEFNKLACYIKQNYGINLRTEKMTLLSGRLSNVLNQKCIESFTDYYQYIVSDKTGIAAIELIDKITTNHTFFMREAAHFQFLRDTVLKSLRDTVKNRDIRIWSAGCSYGQEPYTLAMVMSEFFGNQKELWDTKILATDISTQVLEKAKTGIYSLEEIKGIPVTWRSAYLKKYDDDHYKFNNKIMDEIIFRRLNLMDNNFPFKKKFHAIFCRNVMIYFDNRTKCELVNKFYNLLEEGGYLFIGHSESLDREETELKYVMPAVYRKERKR